MPVVSRSNFMELCYRALRKEREEILDEELHKCPECGSNSLSILSGTVMYWKDDPSKVYYVSCDDCGNWEAKESSIERAVKEWNLECECIELSNAANAHVYEKIIRYS